MLLLQARRKIYSELFQNNGTPDGLGLVLRRVEKGENGTDDIWVRIGVFRVLILGVGLETASRASELFNETREFIIR